MNNETKINEVPVFNNATRNRVLNHIRSEWGELPPLTQAVLADISITMVKSEVSLALKSERERIIAGIEGCKGNSIQTVSGQEALDVTIEVIEGKR